MSTKINVRSPYFVTVQDSNLAAVEFDLRIWNGDITSGRPSTATYSFTKNTVGTNDYIMFEIADYVRDYIETEYADYATNAVWVEWSYQMYSDIARTTTIGSQVTADEVIALDGYGYFEDGINPELRRDILQSNTDIYYQDGNDIVFPVFVEDISTVELNLQSGTPVKWEDVSDFWEDNYSTWDAGNIDIAISDSNDSNFKVKYIKITNSDDLTDGQTVIIDSGLSSELTLTLHKICEPKHTPYRVVFYNKFGAMQELTFFKRSNKQINVSSDGYKRNIIAYSSGATYNTSKHQLKSFNVNGKEKITLNTGFLPENFNDVIRQLLLSEEVWIIEGSDVLPVKPISNSLDFKTSINDKVINYTLDFEYAFDKINSIR